MKSDRKDKLISGTRLELKYCEHCGALWLREPGSEIYCDNCRPQVADLPVPRKKAKRTLLPVGRPSEIDNYPAMDDEPGRDFEAAGGAA